MFVEQCEVCPRGMTLLHFRHHSDRVRANKHCFTVVHIFSIVLFQRVLSAKDTESA